MLKARDSYGVAKNGSPPATFHCDRRLGPAPLRPYSEKRSHYCWHWYWDTGNGDTGNTGPHQLDIARWGMKKNEHPVAVYSTGGIFGFTQDEGKTPGVMAYGGVETCGNDKTTQETPNTQTAAYTYADGKIIELETRGRYTNHEGSAGQEVGNIFYGTEGWQGVECYDPKVRAYGYEQAVRPLGSFAYVMAGILLRPNTTSASTPWSCSGPPLTQVASFLPCNLVAAGRK